mmetsp:Transcript_10487/g.26445  ORF Transcript_10487/g.26445 Transcript_10487/m.26445 type:complete len:224 (-) Transcript_10487:1104-1775(-)
MSFPPISMSSFSPSSSPSSSSLPISSSIILRPWANRSSYSSKSSNCSATGAGRLFLDAVLERCSIVLIVEASTLPEDFCSSSSRSPKSSKLCGRRFREAMEGFCTSFGRKPNLASLRVLSKSLCFFRAIASLVSSSVSSLESSDEPSPTTLPSSNCSSLAFIEDEDLSSPSDEPASSSSSSSPPVFPMSAAAFTKLSSCTSISFAFFCTLPSRVSNKVVSFLR